jgi:hypothetical protein
MCLAGQSRNRVLESGRRRQGYLGRLPEPEEYPQTAELRQRIGFPKVALRIFIQKGGGDEVKKAAENRKRDLLVYVALAKRTPNAFSVCGMAQFNIAQSSLRSTKSRSFPWAGAFSGRVAPCFFRVSSNSG